MKANASPMSVADYCQAIIAKKIIVNQDYQRKEGLWNNAARSFFIESILLEYPIPKLFLYAKLDLKTRETVKEIVDGQQRSQALVAFEGRTVRLNGASAAAWICFPLRPPPSIFVELPTRDLAGSDHLNVTQEFLAQIWGCAGLAYRSLRARSRRQD